jgi:hypothetical protein
VDARHIWWQGIGWYQILLQLGPFAQTLLEVVGSTQNDEVIVGRDVLNHLTVTLIGPANSVEVVEDIMQTWAKKTCSIIDQITDHKSNKRPLSIFERSLSYIYYRLVPEELERTLGHRCAILSSSLNHPAIIRYLLQHKECRTEWGVVLWVKIFVQKRCNN